MTKEFENLDPITFKKQINENHNAVIIDVRTPVEIAEGIIPGAIKMNIFDADFHQRIEDLDKSKHYYVYCRSGNRSSSACGLMIQSGFDKVYNLDGGMIAWNKLSTN